MRRPFTTFFGVDLGGGKGKTTAVARLAAVENGRVRVLEVGTRRGKHDNWYDDILLEYLVAHRDGAVAAVDAPLTLTACVRCQRSECPGIPRCVDPAVGFLRDVAPRLASANGSRGPGGDGAPASVTPTGGPGQKPLTTPYTQRATEVVLHLQHHILPRETLGQGMGPLTARARHLTRALEPHYQLNRNLIEVYPKATVHRLFGARRASRYKREVDTWQTRAAILEELAGELEFAVWREPCLQNDHCFDAVLCAYTAFLWARDGWELPAEHRAVYEQDGYIWIPPDAETKSMTRRLGEAPGVQPAPQPPRVVAARGGTPPDDVPAK